MTTARIIDQIVIEAPTKVGLLAEITTALLGAGVHITAVMGHDMAAGAEVVVVCDDTERAVEALGKTDVSTRLEPVVMMTMPDEVGALKASVTGAWTTGLDVPDVARFTPAG